MKRHKRDCLETYGFDFAADLLVRVIAVLLIGFVVMLSIEAIKDLLN